MVGTQLKWHFSANFAKANAMGGHECNGHTADPPRSCKIFITDRFRGTQGNDRESRMEILC